MIVVKVGGGTSSTSTPSSPTSSHCARRDRVAARARRRADDESGGGRVGSSGTVRDERDRARQPADGSAHARNLRDGLLRPVEQDVGRKAADARASTPSACRDSMAASSKGPARTRCAFAWMDGAWCCETTGPARSSKVNVGLLQLLIGAGYFPVLTPPGSSTAGEAINVDGDRAAAMVAGAFNAEALVILTDQVGPAREIPR